MPAAIRVLETGPTTEKETKLVMTKGMGHPIGPLALFDYIGLDVVLNVAQSIYEETKSTVWATSSLLKIMVAVG